MKKLLWIFNIILLLSVNIYALDDPHGSLSSINCEQCHIPHASLGEILTNSTDSLVATLCLSCHTPGGWSGMTKVMSSSIQATPGVSGKSHSWNVDTLNLAFGANSPQDPALLAHISKDGKVTCGTCHDPHSNANSPFLRLDNSADALCLDCHRSRNNSSVKTYTGNDLSHPVNVALPSANPAFHYPPLDVDGTAQPSDGNTSNDYALGTGDIVKCTSCHGIHKADSNSGTID